MAVCEGDMTGLAGLGGRGTRWIRVGRPGHMTCLVMNSSSEEEEDGVGEKCRGGGGESMHIGLLKGSMR